MIERPRLLPAVILGAMGLLALKLLAWTSEPYPGKIPASSPFLASDTTAKPPAKPAERAKPEEPAKPDKEVWALAKVIAHAHSPDLPLLDPETTGSVDKPDAKKDAEKAEAEAKEEAARAANPLNKAGIINGVAAPTSPAEKALLERLGARREEIESRMRELEMRERLLDTAEKKLDSRVGDLKDLETKAGLGGAPKPAGEEAKAIKNLVIMYEAMKPKDAARVFDRLGLDVLVPVVQQMNPRKMSEVLAAMAPDRAEKLTVALATMARTPVAAGPSLDAAALPGTELPAIAPAPRRR
ncbi:MotE family protein [Bosea sp. R86505]|uniref:MotE family protein n=1 Tax=Bosea sp. R86505 TaxID=3101710 RepID=UPI00366B3676